ncbi:hypothetical protein T12_6164 [Trichinella patagoniensis]|uniref:FLYWCH-type domain-containing protein n=1 Tax=Trichinella patagoniensis TaxID=990121 RepID=A0A0V0Z4V7_9BILA|nr:hypothetical protein T12_6164 [Trichinella patagoniensis]
MADIPELPLVTNCRGDTSIVYENRAYKLRYTGKRVKNWGMHGHLLGSRLHAHRFGVTLSSVHQFLLVPLGRCKPNFLPSVMTRERNALNSNARPSENK